MKKLLLISILSIFAFAVAIAQEKNGSTNEMFEKIKAEKISFFTEKLSLTPAEAQTFWPVYNEFEKKRFDIQRQIHEFEHMPDEKFTSLSDSDIDKMTNNYINSFEKEATLLKEYNKQFLKVLPKKKVLMMYRTENQFRGHLIREYKRGQNKD
jgi:light-regulated signal transduction histidine kinase (bacteriophytochrome)